MTYTINEAIKNEKEISLYVVNTSDNNQRINDKPIKAEVSFPVKSANGQTTNVRIPSTWIPVDLSLQVTKEDLVKSPDLRRLITRGNLELMREEEALEILNKKEAKMEMERLRKMDSINITVQNFAGQLTDSERSSTGLKPAEGNVDAVEVDSLVIELFTREDINDQERYAQLINVKSRLNEKDWAYVIDVTKSDEISEFALECLNELKK